MAEIKCVKKDCCQNKDTLSTGSGTFTHVHCDKSVGGGRFLCLCSCVRKYKEGGHNRVNLATIVLYNN